MTQRVHLRALRDGGRYLGTLHYVNTLNTDEHPWGRWRAARWAPHYRGCYPRLREPACGVAFRPALLTLRPLDVTCGACRRTRVFKLVGTYEAHGAAMVKMDVELERGAYVHPALIRWLHAIQY